MNYLAHLYLAGPDPEAMVGNLMGDFVKGPLIDDDLPLGRYCGILLHRKVDAFSDRHRVVLCSKRRISTGYRRYAGILIDVFYDHFLACDWPRHSEQTLQSFAQGAYAVLAARIDSLPERMQRSVRYMMATDLLPSYLELAGVERSLMGIERRLKRPSQLGAALAELERNYHELQADFRAFFPHLIAFVEQQKTEIIRDTQNRLS